MRFFPFYSGHGISGMGLFAWLSFLAVPSIFAGGISTAFLMKYTGVKDHYVTYTGGVWLVQFQKLFSNVANQRFCCYKGYCETSGFISSIV